jgi:hypothetical protein
VLGLLLVSFLVLVYGLCLMWKRRMNSGSENEVWSDGWG